MRPDPTELLQRHQLQVTPQRLAVLRVVAENPHVTADQVAEAARQELGAISRQAVYNALGVLVDKGLLRRIQPLGSPTLYEDRVGDNHHHLICRDCGRVEDVDCAVGAAPCLTPATDHGYQIERADVTYWGRCAACRARAGSAPAPDHEDYEPEPSADRKTGRDPRR